MLILCIIILSVIIQLTTAFLALRLIVITGRLLSWILLASAMVLQASRRIITIIGFYSDYNLLRLVWINLLDNAVKYTTTREIALIKIDFEDRQDELDFYVRDNVVGFGMQYSRKLFGVFQRLHPSTQFDGTGVGLTNVQRIILRHGGKIWSEAE
jgi:light-regulated signal transduction histidine kinase (bacteriophytochrome)